MSDRLSVSALDGEYEIVYTNTFNTFDNKLTLKDVAGFRIKFLFDKDKEQKGTAMDIKGDNDKKEIIIKLTNFDNVLGAGTTKRIKLIETDDSKSLYFSIYTKSLNPEVSFLQVTVTLYLK